MAKIFINYRRKDSAPYAGRLYDRLAGHFGPDHVFMDIDQIEPGEVFDQVIQDKLKAVQAAVVLIGANWMDVADANGQRRLDDPDDWVRLEIAALLERDVRVIPVLVGGAAMPKSTQLPECLIPLTRRQAIEITDHRFHTDTDKLIKALEKILGVPALKQPESPKKLEEPEKSGLPRFAVFAGMVVVLAVGIYFSVMSPKPTLIQSELVTPKPINQPVTESPKAAVIEPEMARIPSGKFQMGSPESEPGRLSTEGPQHEVTIDYTFEIGKYEVTFDEYDAFAKATQRKLPSDQGWGRGKRPVSNVSWKDAQAYAKWLSEQTRKKYRLPTEAEWEYAARAGTQTAYWWGDDIVKINAICISCDNQWVNQPTTLPVDSFKANSFGLHGTAGNVWELVEDCWHDNYREAPVDGSAWKEANGGDCSRRVTRGGTWSNLKPSLRSALRVQSNPDEVNPFQGFRIARDF